jgi:hypothetical protein
MATLRRLVPVGSLKGYKVLAFHEVLSNFGKSEIHKASYVASACVLVIVVG